MFDFVDNDIPDHTLLDAQVYESFGPDRTKVPPPAALILVVVVGTALDKFDQKFNSITTATDIVKKYSLDGDENSNLTKLLNWCWRQGTFEKIRRLEILRPRSAHHWENKLDVFYTKPFIGNAATDFIKFLSNTDKDIQSKELNAYAKVISVLQSSGMGKSRMLTEVGSYIFTLPICLRHPHSPGYPPSDEGVYNYFARITTNNDRSYTAHSAIARFLTAAHEVMLKWLKGQHEKFGEKGLHAWWYGIMERKSGRNSRGEFFSEVLKRANTIQLCPDLLGCSPKMPGDKRDRDDNMEQTSKMFYKGGAQAAVEALMEFLNSLYDKPLCVTYFDEAHVLEMRFWVLLRLLSHQDLETKMWYVFMGTKSSVSYFTPPSKDLHSLRLLREVQILLPPYFALDFDHNKYKGLQEVTTIGKLQSLTHLASYGRPMWMAHLPEDYDNMVDMASLKLTNGLTFDDQNRDHVFAVLSQRLCIEPVLVGSEAVQLANRSVAHHMRLITGISDDRRTLYTYSPSEPILVLGAVDILHSPDADKRLGRVLDTFSKHLCSAGLVEKGLMGELGARILLILARDFAVPAEPKGGRNLLRPVPLLRVIDTLFGNTEWAGKDQMEMEKAFAAAHVNFTHWIVTKDPLPEMPDQNLLANLWARGAILQCCFKQESIDFMMVVYYGKIDTEEIFDPTMLSAVFGQVKFKSKADMTADQAIRPIGLPRSLSGPLPHLAFLFELGNESNHAATRTKIKVTTPTPTKDKFQKLRRNWLNALEALEQYEEKHPGKKHKEPEFVAKQNKVKTERLAMDAYNRYTIAVRGASASTYGILNTANVEKEFSTLLNSTMASPADQDEIIQHMRPLERLGLESGHTAWMSRNFMGESKENLMDVDL